MLNRAYRYRIYPTPEQSSRLAQFAGASRFVYNLALEQRRDWWRQFRGTTGRSINWASQSREVTDLRAELPWLADTPRCISEQALRDLDKAFSAFFANRAGYPAFRSRDNNMSFRVQGVQTKFGRLNKKWATLRIPNCDPIKVRISRDVVGSIKSVTVRLDGGKWYAAFATEKDVTVASGSTRQIGVDRGVANTISLSNGKHFQMPDVTAMIAARKRAQRRLARGQKGSARRVRARQHFAITAARLRGVRSHWLHEQSTFIARQFGLVAMEKLNVKNMTASTAGTGRAAKAGLNRSILEQGWSIFAAMLEYKLAERGGQVEYVNPAYTSQTCSDCGSVSADNRKSQAVFECIDCGHRAHADTNAAINILRRSPAWQRVEGSSCRPVEARIGKVPRHLKNLAA